MHGKHSEHVKNMTYKMGGFYLKTAQFMSVLDDFVPPEYMKWVKDTQDNVPSAFANATEVFIRLHMVTCYFIFLLRTVLAIEQSMCIYSDYISYVG